MKKLLAILLCLTPRAYAGTVTFASISTAGAYSNIQHTSCNANTSTGNCVYGSAVTAHSLLIEGCVMGGETTNTLTVSDNNSNTWLKALPVCVIEGNGAGTRCADIFYALNANAGATTVTCHDTNNVASVIQQSIGEYGATAAAAFDVASSSSPAGTVVGSSGGTITTSAKSEFVFAFATLLGGAVTGQSGTLRENYVNNYYQATEDTTVANVGVYSSSFTQSTPAFNIGMQAAFK